MNARRSRAARAAAVVVAGGALAATALAGGGNLHLTPVRHSRPATAGESTPTELSPQLLETVVAQGDMKVENPATIVANDDVAIEAPDPAVKITHYGFDGDGPPLPKPGDVQTKTHKVEATKTEPDQNTYLVMPGLQGPDAKYDYGSHFLFQGHEGGVNDAGYVTRVNLDADLDHRVTLLASKDQDGKQLPVLDGSTWDPFTKTLLVTAEEGPTTGGVWSLTPDYPSKVVDLAGTFGRASYEAVHPDPDGNVRVVEDSGGSNGSTAAKLSHARQPNSFVYRLVPKDPSDLTEGGKLQVLQVLSNRKKGEPIVFHAGKADDDILSSDRLDLHTYGLRFATKWVTIHDTAVDGTKAFDANALAKKAGGTPFKRPENGIFRPGGGLRQFYFDETGDTNLLSEAEAGTEYGSDGAVYSLTQSSPSADTGTLRLLYRGDPEHNAFDNVTFLTRDQLVAVEDAGATVHKQRNGLDQGYVLNVRDDYGRGPAYGTAGGPAPVRIIAEGRDPLATSDALLRADAANNGFQNEDDNELTGIFVSNGDPSLKGLHGADVPTPFRHGWRMFYTTQHGLNQTFEVLPRGD
jgi:hypothetical protein